MSESPPKSSAAGKEGKEDRRFRLPLGLNVAAALFLAILVAIFSFVSVWWLLGQPDLRAGGFEARDRLDIVKIALATVAGVGGVVALVVAYRKQRLNEAEDRRKEADSARENTKLLTERFGRAADQLGSERAAVRLSGLHALANLADDWAAGRQMCISVLCSYLQMPYSTPTPSKLPWKRPDVAEQHREKGVRATAFRLIADRLRPGAEVTWRGHTFDFKRAVVDSADFKGCIFDSTTMISFEGATFPSGGFVDFRDASFEGGVVDFTAASFSGAAIDFNSASIVDGAVVQFAGSDFSGGEIDFVCVEIQDGWLDLAHSSFSGALVRFNGTKVTGGGIQFSGSTISGGEVRLYHAEASGDGLVNFAGVQAIGGFINLEGFRSTEPNQLRIFRADLDAAHPTYSAMSADSHPPDFSD